MFKFYFSRIWSIMKVCYTSFWRFETCSNFLSLHMLLSLRRRKYKHTRIQKTPHKNKEEVYLSSSIIFNLYFPQVLNFNNIDAQELARATNILQGLIRPETIAVFFILGTISGPNKKLFWPCRVIQSCQHAKCR